MDEAITRAERFLDESLLTDQRTVRLIHGYGTGQLKRALAGFLQRRATADQFREFVVHRSVYTLREADPHSFAIPRLAGAAKAALIEIQLDEYGNGRLPRMHAELFRATMDHFGLDTTVGAHLDRVPAVTLAVRAAAVMSAVVAAVVLAV